MSFFCADRLTAGYGGAPVLQEVSFSLQAGTVTGVLGGNGSGKSTLLKSVCGILPHSGSCTLEGERLETLSPRRLARLCGYVPQSCGIAINISLLDVVLMGFNPCLGLLERPSRAMRQEARRALALVGLEGREEDGYLTLSEGQKRLCVLARALAGGGSLLLLDEPESALDVSHRWQLMSLLRQWVRAGRRAALVTLHDPGLALNGCDSLILLKEGAACGLLQPGRDDLASMEAALEQIYGGVTLARCLDRTGREQLVMLKEQEEPSGPPRERSC